VSNQHPITPPPELVQEWCHQEGDEIKTSPRWFQIVATQAARWGADQELEAILKLAGEPPLLEWDRCFVASLREERRPKPPTLKERAQAELDRLIALIPTEGAIAMAEPIRKALEALPND
jgi:hypothetical protein